jgi:hypothetical protein
MRLVLQSAVCYIFCTFRLWAFANSGELVEEQRCSSLRMARILKLLAALALSEVRGLIVANEGDKHWLCHTLVA